MQTIEGPPLQSFRTVWSRLQIFHTFLGFKNALPDLTSVVDLLLASQGISLPLAFQAHSGFTVARKVIK